MAGYNIDRRKFERILKWNNFIPRQMQATGHNMWKNYKTGVVVSLPTHLNPIIIERIIKENNLILNKHDLKR